MRSATPSVYGSFWQAGYEGADHVNYAQQPVSMNVITGHIDRVRTDYALLRQFDIRTVRETVGWRLVERDGEFDFSLIATRARVAQEMGLQICWTFCHYGWPSDIDVYGPDFIPRFARFCRHVAAYLAPFSVGIPIFSPINEISFTSWGLSIGMFHCLNMDHNTAAEEGKRQLVRAAIAGCDAIWESIPQARILHCDPLIHLVSPENQDDGGEARDIRSSQFDAWDMLCGRKDPELGGAPRYLDLMGANYYHGNQWESRTNKKLCWHLADRRRVPLHHLLVELYERYRRPLLVAETSHVGSGRGIWMREIAEEVAHAVQKGVDLSGICIYPIIDRPDWNDPCCWHRSGLWDVAPTQADPLERILCLPYAAAIRQAQQLTQNLCTTNALPGRKERTMPTIIVFCHLRWDFVYQRPQQLLSRMAQHYKILFIEEPLFHDGESFMEVFEIAPNVTVYRPNTPISAAGFHDDQLPILKPLLAQIVTTDDHPIVWFYTPMALPLLQELQPGLVVYDCMDELSGFKNSPKQLLQRESALLNIADVLFTGGPSLYEAKRKRHHNAYCFPSSVDVIHFEQALDRTNAHPAQDDIDYPRLGFFGVIDERFDAALITALACAHPEWQIVLVGPVVKIDPITLPRAPNIHYLGQQPYKVLPQLLAGWNVCLLPFALNDATRYISPTKVLEYMAAELPIVSTAIADVEQPYGSIVTVARDIPAFIAGCEQALALTVPQKSALIAKMRAVVAATSWDDTVAQMNALVKQSIAKKQHVTLPGPTEVIGFTDETEREELEMHGALQFSPCVIVGAGPTGLSAAYHYGEGAILVEKNAEVGGWCRSVKDRGFTFDHAGHIMFSNDSYVLNLYKILLGDNLHWQNREAWIYSKGVHTRYPFQGALYGLPPAVITECLLGAIEARYGTQDTLRPRNLIGICGAQTEKLPPVEDCCGDGTIGSDGLVTSAVQVPEPPNFEQFIYKVWGAGIARHFAIPYNKKLWTVPLTEMETSWLGGRVPLPDLKEIIHGALEPVAKPMGPNAHFGYPLKGGFQALMNGFLPHIKGKVATSTEIVQLLPREHIVTLSDGRRVHYDHLISTMPLPELVKLIGKEAPAAVRAAALALRYVSIRCVNLGVARENVTDKHWIYYPEDSIFHRIFVQGNTSPLCNPPGGFGLTCEISYSPWKPLPFEGQDLINRCVADCVKVGMLTSDDKLLVSNLVDIPYAYVVYDHARLSNVATIKTWLAQHDVVLAGRYSEWEYYNSDHAFLAGKKAAEAILAGQYKKQMNAE